MNQSIFLEQNMLPPGTQCTNSINVYQSVAVPFSYITARSQEIIRHATASILSIARKVILSIVSYITKKIVAIKEYIAMPWAPTLGPPIIKNNSINDKSQHAIKSGAEIFCVKI